MGLYENALPIQGEFDEHASSRRALHALPPASGVVRDPTSLVESLRFLDPAVALAVLLAQLVLLPTWAGGEALFETFRRPLPLSDVLLLGAFTGWWYLSFVVLGMYRPHRIERASDELVAVAVASAAGVAPLLPYLWLTGAPSMVGDVLAIWVAAAACALGVRSLLRYLWTFAGAPPGRRILIVGSGPRAHTLLRQLGNGARDGVRVVGHLDSGERRGRLEVPYLGELEALESVLMQTAVDAVVIALPIKSCYAEVQRTIEVCERIGVVAEYPADVFHCDRAEPRLDPSRERAVVAIGLTQDDGRRRVKRALDLAGALLGLLLLAPLMLLIAAAIRLSGPGPILFVQERCGRNRHSFPMYKFRTMVCDAEALQPQLEHLNEAGGPVFKIRLDPRITPLGRILRRTSLDELPQLLNVLRGDMSLVGPRPLPLRDVHRFSAASALRRFSVRPGLTCLWQVNGRNDVPFDDWMTLDLQYIDRWSLLLDLRILLRTVPAVLRGQGAA